MSTLWPTCGANPLPARSVGNRLAAPGPISFARRITSNSSNSMDDRITLFMSNSSNTGAASVTHSTDMLDMLTSDWFVFNRMSLTDFQRWRQMCGRGLSDPTLAKLTCQRLIEAAGAVTRKAAKAKKRKRTA